MKICLVGNILSWNITDEELLEKYFLFETNNKVEISEPFKYKEKYYYVNSIRNKTDITVVREFCQKEVGERNFEGEITCPYCGTIDDDSWERASESEDEEICDVCGSTFSWTREVEVTYSSQPVKKYEIKEIS